MRLARFRHDGRSQFGMVSPGETDLSVTAIAGGLFDSWERTGPELPMSEVTLLSPLRPSKIIGIAGNYRSWEGTQRELLVDPYIFFKPPTGVIGTGQPIDIPRIATGALHEVELAVVIGTICRNADAASAENFIFGYTCSNDVTAMGLPATSASSNITGMKAFDTFCPLGPWIETELAVDDLGLRCYVGDELRQDGRTSGMVRDVGELVAQVSTTMTLLPGDVILTGTPRDYGLVEPGKNVTVAVEGIGELVNPVRADCG